jgi:hypothetical protein
MKKIAGFLAFIVLSCLSMTDLHAQELKDYGKSMALVLRIEGTNKVMNDIQVYKQNVFSGKVKNIYSQGSVHSTSALHVIVMTPGEEVLLDAILDNPLDLILESFDPDGTIEQTHMVKEEGFVNIRFPLPASSTALIINCYQMWDSTTEQLVKTIETTYDAK